MNPILQTTAVASAMTSDAAHCPLCGGPNDCQLCTAAAYKGPCWCETEPIPEALLARISVAYRNRACLCRACVASFHRESAGSRPQPTLPGDFYFDAQGLMVFTARYLMRCGACCGNDCRHCPYQRAKL